jgi:hypothetical protein
MQSVIDLIKIKCIWVGWTLVGLHLILFLSITTSYAENTPVTLKGVSLKVLNTYKHPSVVDIDPLRTQLTQILSGLEALVHMSQMVAEEHARKALKAQVSSLKIQIESLQKQLRTQNRIDYSVPPPIVAKPSKTNPKGVQSNKTKNIEYPEPMNSTRLSQHWSALERAPFREDKMAVIRKVSREEYMKVGQAEILIENLTFSRDRKSAIILLYTKLVDPENIQRLYNLLDQPAHQRKVKAEIDQINMSRRLKR